MVLVFNMKRDKDKVQLIEKGNKLYVYIPESEKKNIDKFFEGLSGIVKTKKSATELIREMRREIDMNSKFIQHRGLKQRA